MLANWLSLCCTGGRGAVARGYVKNGYSAWLGGGDGAAHGHSPHATARVCASLTSPNDVKLVRPLSSPAGTLVSLLPNCEETGKKDDGVRSCCPQEARGLMTCGWQGGADAQGTSARAV